jgi:hypothetical protein
MAEIRRIYEAGAKVAGCPMVRHWYEAGVEDADREIEAAGKAMDVLAQSVVVPLPVVKERAKAARPVAV